MSNETLFLLKRKILHFLLVIYPLYFLILGENWREYALISSIFLFFIWVASEIIRIKLGFENTPTGLLIKSVSKKYRAEGKDADWFRFRNPKWIMANFVTLLFFSGLPLIAGIAVFALGDAAAGFIGKRFGKIRLLGTKTLEGFVAGAVFGFTLAYVLTNDFKISAFAAMVGMIAELVAQKFDDNYIIGFFAALGGEIARWI